MPTPQHKKGKTGLTIHTSAVAMAPARALTSHARRHYHEHYKGRYRYPALVFGFDMFLIGVAAVLLVLDLVVLLGGGQGLNGGLALDLNAPPLRASDISPVVATVRATDNRTHEGVTLRWDLPEWVQVVSAQPPMAKDGTIQLGTITPGNEATSHLVLRVRAPVGTSVPFNFSVHQFDLFKLVGQLTGSETRAVTSAALTATPAVSSTLVAQDASVPILVSNDSKTPAHSVVLRVTQHDGAPQASIGSDDEQFIGDLAPGEKRLAFVDLGQISATSVVLGYELQDEAQVVDSHLVTYQLASAAAVPNIQAIASSDHLSITSNTSGHPWRLLVDHPQDPLGPVDMLSLGQPQTVALDATRQSSSTEWTILPIDDGAAGGILLPRQNFPLTQTFPAAVAVRYYAESGDQLGVGPLPPTVGQATTYWVVWTLGPTEEDFSNIQLTATLGQGVSSTGKFASQIDSMFSSQGPASTWDIPQLRATGASSLPSFAFEVSFTPDASDTGMVPVLVPGAHAQGVSTKTGKTFQQDFAPLTTDLVSDTKAAGEGTVQP
ncbi:MAG: hypothetical protein WA001_00290 [Patescibacteria group bacterium]